MMNQWMKNDESNRFRERFVVVTENITIVIYSACLAYSVFILGGFFNEVTAERYYQTHFYVMNTTDILREVYIYYIPFTFALTIDFWLRRKSRLGSNIVTDYFVKFFSGCLWLVAFIFFPWGLVILISDPEEL